MTGQNRGLVLVVEDERAIAELVRTYLVRDGFSVIIESTGEAALATARRHRPVALILDIMLPDMEGTEVCRRLRGRQDWTPVLFLTARDEEVDRLLGLELGGDDYITKPFSPRELVARVRAVLRRTSGVVAEEIRCVGPVKADMPRRRVFVEDGPVELTATEFDLLAHLLKRPGRVCTRSDLLAAVWGHRSDVGARTVDVHIAQLRAKLGQGAGMIRTVRGVGYSVEE
ncbi:response regulator transcription factor [Streptomyces sp. NBC_01775]|uniref:response regulator transcription factor n=1 Tax=Streptomyces sp. NBC_01775 TaxID=2975939 RepID=UPI002DD966D1|nr:response regulator transcription factor [Streptomyces sp. NBC_01775]